MPFNPECDYSFDMLYRAAYGKSLGLRQKMKMQRLPQEKINQLVAKWAKKADWKTVMKSGSDNTTYLAFYPKS